MMTAFIDILSEIYYNKKYEGPRYLSVICFIVFFDYILYISFVLLKLTFFLLSRLVITCLPLFILFFLVKWCYNLLQKNKLEK